MAGSHFGRWLAFLRAARFLPTRQVAHATRVRFSFARIPYVRSSRPAFPFSAHDPVRGRSAPTACSDVPEAELKPARASHIGSRGEIG